MKKATMPLQMLGVYLDHNQDWDLTGKDGRKQHLLAYTDSFTPPPEDKYEPTIYTAKAAYDALLECVYAKSHDDFEPTADDVLNLHNILYTQVGYDSIAYWGMEHFLPLTKENAEEWMDKVNSLVDKKITIKE